MTARSQKAMLTCLLLFCVVQLSLAQGDRLVWSSDGNSYYKAENGDIDRYAMPGRVNSMLVSRNELSPDGKGPLEIKSFAFSKDEQKLLVYTNSRRVWRLETRGDYWVFDLQTKKLNQIGKGRPASSLMFAKFSPDGTKVAYVSEHNLYVEDLATGTITPLTKDGNRKLIYGTFDWVYEEEFNCRDGFSWSPDSQHIAFWQIDASGIRDYYMLNMTDSAHSRVIPVEYPTIGERPSGARIGVTGLNGGPITWLALPGNPTEHFLPRMEWNSASEILVQQLDRKQQESLLFWCNALNGDARMIHAEKDSAWVDVFETSPGQEQLHFVEWITGNTEFLWMSEKDGWRHLYRISLDGKKETLVTAGDFDVMDLKGIDQKNGIVYFTASPSNATQQYLYKARLYNPGKTERVTPPGEDGWHNYTISPSGRYAQHTFSSANASPYSEWIDLVKNKPLNEKESAAAKAVQKKPAHPVEFFKIKTEDNVEMDGWMVKPSNFDPSKKYPVVFFVYTEPASQTVLDRFGVGRNRMYRGDMANDGYLYISLDGRGTPGPKGSKWRKSIYRKIGQLNIRDQAMAAKEILKWSFVDPERVAVWGWSGGGSTTLNLMFQYPEIYKTGIAIAAVANQLTYDNIYQERYMGLPQENLQDILNGSPVTHAGKLKGNLLYIHGTGDDNVHYNNAEMLLNELIRNNKQFQFMAYPNRSHGISEGEGTSEHLTTLYTEYLRKYCPPGPR